MNADAGMNIKSLPSGGVLGQTDSRKMRAMDGEKVWFLIFLAQALKKGTIKRMSNPERQKTRITFSEKPSKPVEISVTLSEDGKVADRIQILRVATIHDHRYGTVNVTKRMLSEMVKNFKAGVRGIDLMIDYSHDTGGEAAGWITNLELSEDGLELWANVSWTPSGRVALEEKKFRYVSADFDQNYKDNESMKAHGIVLLGAALTNRPVIKKMKSTTQLGEKPMDEIIKKLMAMLGITDESQLESKVSSLLSEKKMMGDKVGEIEAEKKQLSEDLKATNTKLSEANEKISRQEKEGKFNVMLAEGKVVEAQRDSFITGDMIKFAENAGTINKKPAGHGGSGDNDPVSSKEEAEDKIIELSEAKAKSDKITLSEAQRIVMKENPELAKKYHGQE